MRILVFLLVVSVGLTGASMALSASTSAFAGAAPSQLTGTLTIAKSVEPISLDPHVHDGPFSVRVHSAVYETLVDMRWDAAKGTLVIEPLLAESWRVSPNGMVYRFRLRRNVRFHDGTPFTAEAVRVSFERNKKMGKRPSYQTALIERIETPDDHNVVIHLKESWTPFLQAVAMAYIVSPKAVRDNDRGDNAERFFNDNMVGTGPYRFVQFVPNSIITLARFPGYWRGWSGRHFDRIVLRHVPEPATQRLLLERGEVDFAIDAIGTSPDDIERMRNVSGVVAESKPTDTMYMYTLKLRGPLADINVRRALQHAFNYEGFIRGVMRGHASPALGGPIPPGMTGYCPDKVTRYDFNLARAREALSQSSFPNGGFTLELWIFPAFHPVGGTLLFADALRQLNITLRVRQETAPSIFLAQVTRRDSPVDITSHNQTTLLPDPDAMIRPYYYTNGVLTHSWYSNPQVDAWFDQARVLPNGPSRHNLYCEIAQAVTRDAVSINISRVHRLHAYRADIKGYFFHQHATIREFRYWDMYRER